MFLEAIKKSIQLFYHH